MKNFQCKIHFLQTLILLGVLFSTSAFAQESRKPNIDQIKQKWLDIAYATTSQAQKLDVYLQEGDGPFPVILSVHGGAFKDGDK